MAQYTTRITGSRTAGDTGLQRIQESRSDASLELLRGIRDQFRGQAGTLRLLHTTDSTKQLKFKSAGGFKTLFCHRSASKAGKTVLELMKKAGVDGAEINRFEAYIRARGNRAGIPELIRVLDKILPAPVSDRDEATAMSRFGIDVPNFGQNVLGRGGFGTVVEATLNGVRGYALKDHAEPVRIRLDAPQDGGSSGNTSATAKLSRGPEVAVSWMKGDVKNVIRPSAYLIVQTARSDRGDQTFHVVPGGKQFRSWAENHIKGLQETHMFEVKTTLMPQVMGASLAENRELNNVQLAQSARKTFDALIGMAKHGFIHGDLKPDNIMEDGQIIDTGNIQKVHKSNPTSVVGTNTPEYLLPNLVMEEQIGKVDSRLKPQSFGTFERDLYAFGLSYLEAALRAQGKKADIYNLFVPGIRAAVRPIPNDPNKKVKYESDAEKFFEAIKSHSDRLIQSRIEGEPALSPTAEEFFAPLKEYLRQNRVNDRIALFSLKCMETAFNEYRSRNDSVIRPFDESHPLFNLSNELSMLAEQERILAGGIRI
jgi:serine/threonine protein kinase